MNVPDTRNAVPAKAENVGIAAAWRFSMLRLMLFATLASAALGLGKLFPDIGLLFVLLWIAGTLLCLRAGDPVDTVKLIFVSFAVVFVLFVILAMPVVR